MTVPITLLPETLHCLLVMLPVAVALCSQYLFMQCVATATVLLLLLHCNTVVTVDSVAM